MQTQILHDGCYSDAIQNGVAVPSRHMNTLPNSNSSVPTIPSPNGIGTNKSPKIISPNSPHLLQSASDAQNPRNGKYMDRIIFAVS